MWKHHFPHAREISDHVANRGKQHAIDKIEPARHAKLDCRARNAANIALVVGIAVNHFELIATSQDTERQHVGGVNNLARNVKRHIANHLAAGLRRLPFPRGSKRQIFEQRLSARDDRTRGRSFQRCVHWALLLAMKDSMPSTASWVFINSST